MAAPAQAYFLIDYKFRGSNGVEMTVNPAKAQADIATLKARFYLDEVIGFKANYGGVEYHGFWGMVLPSGFNYNHHKTSRMLEINGPKPGQILRTFNDAGLNTMGNCNTPSLTTATIGEILLSVDLLTAFYCAATSYGLVYKINGGSPITVETFTAIAQNTFSAKSLLISNDSIKAGDTILVTSFITNDEGVYASTGSASFTATPKTAVMKFNNTYASSAYSSGSNVTIYFATVNIGINTLFYTNLAMTTLPSQGYYVLGEIWYEVRPATINSEGVMKVVATGACISSEWPTSDPQYYTGGTDTGAYTTINVFFNSSSYVDPCSKYNEGNLSIRYLYLREFNGVYYKNSSLTTLADTGYYVWGGVWRYINAGLASNPTTCPTGV
jgi:hypothetical protein